MSLLIAFDDLNSRGNRFILDYLTSQFPSVLLDSTKLIDDINGHPAGKCLFTTCPYIAHQASSLVTTILYLNHCGESHSSRGENVSNWRQCLTMFKSVSSIFVASSALATTFLNTYKISCKVQYPHAPQQEKANPCNIIFNRYPAYMDQIVNAMPNESFLLYSKEEDFAKAKLYIHIPDPGEQWHFNIVMAHTYGVPCFTYQQGCFSEFCTSGDKLIAVGADFRTWMSHFKIAMRDQSINSKIVYDMSQRFHTMNEIQQRIKKALIDNGMRQPPPTFAEIQEKASGVDSMKKLQSRRSIDSPTFVQKIVRPPSRKNDYQGVNSFLESNASIYAGVGGLGDAVITLAAAEKEPGSKIIFGASAGVKEPIKQLFDAFGIESMIMQNFNGSIEGLIAWQSIVEHRHCKGSIHIPKDLNYGDWGNNAKKYLNKVSKNMSTQQIGKLVNPRATKKVVGVCPRGSDHSAVWKQRYMTRDEFQRIVRKLLAEESTVIVFGSAEDLSYYGVYQDNNVLFMNSNFAVSHPAPKYNITMRHMLTAIHSCEYIISVDTWLKTYAAIVGIPCKVIMNRYFGKSTLDYSDPSDRIFLDPNFWGFDIVTIDSLL